METQAIIGTVLISVIGWSLLQIHQHNAKIATLSTGQTTIQNDLKGIKEDIGELNQKLNLFLKSELDTLKELVKSTAK
jgi:peptidoglycan hydrolase CwlO-like protein